MDNTLLTKLWSTIALVALYFAFNGIADVQNSAFLLPLIIEVGDDRGAAAKAIFWFLLATLPYLLALYLARVHIERNTGGPTLTAWPVMFGLTLEMNDPLARYYQWFWIVLLLALPLWASMFLLNEVFELLVFQRKHEQEILARGWLEHLTTFRLGHDYRVRSEEGGGPVSYYPGFQPVIFLALLLSVFYHWIRTVTALVRIQGRRAAVPVQPRPLL